MIPEKGSTPFVIINTGLLGRDVPRAQDLFFTIPVPS